MQKLIPLLAFAVLAGCKTIPLNYDKIQPGQNTEQVTALLGEPGDTRTDGAREAWQYCEVATMSDNFFAVLFEDGVVTGIQRYKTAGLVGGPCGGYKDILARRERPRQAPDARTARREAVRATREAALAELAAPQSAPAALAVPTPAPPTPQAAPAKPAPVTPQSVLAAPAPARESGRQEGTVYTRFNIHAADDVRNGAHTYNACYSGWVAPPGIGHVILPPNTQVAFMRWRNGFAMKETETGRVILYEFSPERMRMDASEYFRQITSEEPVVLAGLPAEDLKGIKAGVVSVGMSKQGVLTAYGMPPKHKTPSLEENVWYYWKNRFRTMAIGFDEQGLVREIKD